MESYGVLLRVVRTASGRVQHGRVLRSVSLVTRRLPVDRAAQGHKIMTRLAEAAIVLGIIAASITSVRAQVYEAPNQAGGKMLVAAGQSCNPDHPDLGSYAMSYAEDGSTWIGCATVLDDDHLQIVWNNGQVSVVDTGRFTEVHHPAPQPERPANASML